MSLALHAWDCAVACGGVFALGRPEQGTLYEYRYLGPVVCE
jgi:hypothetical protein